MYRLKLVGFLCAVVTSASPTQAQDLHVFFGNLHSHTSYSDGSGTPEEAYRHARYSAGLDFLAITEHNHRWAEMSAGDRKDGLLIATNPALYNGQEPHSLIQAAGRFTEDNEFIALYGQEFSSISKGNHVNVFDVPNVIPVGNGDYDELINWTKEDANKDTTGNPAFIQFNHPALFTFMRKEYGRDDFSTPAEWLATMDAQVQLIELLNGPAMTRSGGRRPAEVAEEDYAYYLSLGFHISPTADQDNHYFTWGTATDARTGVVMESLTKANLMNALRNRHTFSSEDKNLEVIYWLNGELMGTVKTDQPTSLKPELSIFDPDEPNASYEIEVFSGLVGGQQPNNPIDAYSFEGNTDPGEFIELDEFQYTGPHQFVFLKITQFDEDGNDDRLWTAPVWFEAGSVVASAPSLRIVGVKPNPNGPDEPNEAIRIENSADTDVSLNGWKIRDGAGRYWLLDTEIVTQNGNLDIIRNNRPMYLNNDKDTVELVDPSGSIVHSVSYENAPANDWVTVFE